jgi:serine/threonine protein kinase
VQRRTCPFCESFLEGTVEWCYYCGKKLPNATATDGAPKIRYAEHQTTEQAQPKKPPERAPSMMRIPVAPIPGADEIVARQLKIGNFTITSKLGTGGMGTVYLGEHAEVGKRVAIKILRPELASNRDSLARFTSEARIVTRLKHPSIVDVYDFGYLPEIGCYLIMEYLEGDNLLGYLQQRGALSPYETAFIGWQIVDALETAHQANVIHRDLKLENVFLVRWGGRTIVKLLDFGLAKLLDPQEGDPTLITRAGIVLGTPAYMSPEQAAGRKEIDGRADLYSVGVIMFELVTGQSPFFAPNPNELLTIKQIEPAPPASAFAPGIPKPQEQLILRLMERVPKDRPPNARVVRTALGQMLPALPRKPVSEIAIPIEMLQGVPLVAELKENAAPPSPEEVMLLGEHAQDLFFKQPEAKEPRKPEPKLPSPEQPKPEPPKTADKPWVKQHNDMQSLRAAALGDKPPTPALPLPKVLNQLASTPTPPEPPSKLPWIIASASSLLAILFLILFLTKS